MNRHLVHDRSFARQFFEEAEESPGPGRSCFLSLGWDETKQRHSRPAVLRALPAPGDAGGQEGPPEAPEESLAWISNRFAAVVPSL